MKIKYKKCIVVYIDILGFKDKIFSASSNPEKIKSIYSQLNRSKLFLEAIKVSGQNNDIRINTKAFSDSIFISSPYSSFAEFLQVLSYIAIVQLFLTYEGVFLRGGITIGDHYEDEHTHFGPAMIKAYELEKLANWQRIIIDPAVLNEFNIAYTKMIKAHICRQDADGVMYIDYLKFSFYFLLSRFIDGKAIIYKLPEHLLLQHQVAILLALRTDAVKSNIKILTKYHNQAIYHNSTIDEIANDFPRILSYASNIKTILHHRVKSRKQLALLKTKSSTKIIRAIYKKDILSIYRIPISKSFAKLYGVEVNERV